jgi:4-diphosphocytidyl-2-C-methyl-D-erythritol kinase
MLVEARVSAFAKLNLDLRVLYKRTDGYHELRSIFQTISLADEIRIRFSKSRRTAITLAGNLDIPDNLVVRAAQVCLDELRLSAAIDFELQKRIPMGGGLGGGSSDAAAVLLALPALARKPVAMERLIELAAQLGSDVPFFLLGGTAAVLGRGDELYPVPDLRSPHVLLVSPDIHVSTPEAYRLLSPRLTAESAKSKLAGFQAQLWTHDLGTAVNDFEPVVFEQHPRLKTIRNQLRRAGATIALMTGSGSSIFGIFESRQQLVAARGLFPNDRVAVVRFITRKAYLARTLLPGTEAPCGAATANRGAGNHARSRLSGGRAG